MRCLTYAALAAGLFCAAGCAESDAGPSDSPPQPVSAADQANITAGLAESMRDPASTRFRSWRTYPLGDSERAVCGEVDAKDASGAYIGYLPFYVLMRGDEEVTILLDAPARQACDEAAGVGPPDPNGSAPGGAP